MNPNAIATILNLYYTDESLSTSDLAKLVFQPEDKHELRNADNKVRHYLQSYEWLFDTEKEDGRKVYSLKEDSVVYGVGRIQVVGQNEEASIGLGNTMVYMDEDGDPQVVDVEAEADSDVTGYAGSDEG